MGKADVYAGDYLENPEVFADLLNGILYHGEQIVKPEELQEQDGELRSIAGRDAKKTIRDKVRLWRGTAFAVFVVENQMKVDYRMVMNNREWYGKLSNQTKALLAELANIREIPGVTENDLGRGKNRGHKGRNKGGDKGDRPQNAGKRKAVFRGDSRIFRG